MWKTLPHFFPLPLEVFAFFVRYIRFKWSFLPWFTRLSVCGEILKVLHTSKTIQQLESIARPFFGHLWTSWTFPSKLNIMGGVGTVRPTCTRRKTSYIFRWFLLSPVHKLVPIMSAEIKLENVAAHDVFQWTLGIYFKPFTFFLFKSYCTKFRIHFVSKSVTMRLHTEKNEIFCV